MQFNGSFELLRPNLKDVLYQLEVNTFRDGLIARNDHAGCGMMLARWEGDSQVGRGEADMYHSFQLVNSHLNSHLACPFRLGEGGKLDKGPMGMGLRLQDSLRLGAFKVEACAAKVATDGAQGGKDEAWGGRAFVRYDWLPVRGWAGVGFGEGQCT